MNRPTISQILFNKLDKLDIDGKLDKFKLVEEIYGEYDYFSSRTFDVHYAKAKKMFKDKTFKTVRGFITRIIHEKI